MWIPGHSSIDGNKKTDSYAKTSAASNTLEQIHYVQFQDIKKSIKLNYLIVWQTHWRNQNTKLNQIKR